MKGKVIGKMLIKSDARYSDPFFLVKYLTLLFDLTTVENNSV